MIEEEEDKRKAPSEYEEYPDSTGVRGIDG